MDSLNNRNLLQIEPTYSRAEVFELIDHAAKNLRRIERMTVSEAGISPPQYHLLRSLWEQDRLALKDLARASNCSRATITGLVDGLEEKGLVRRIPNPEDRRSLLAELTENGRALREQTHALQSVYSECCEGLAPNQFQQLGVLLARLNYSLS